MWVFLRMVLMLTVAAADTAHAAALPRDWINVEQPLAQDLYLVGREVRIGARISGDVTAAGMNVRIDAIVDDDVNVAGEHISVQAPVVDDLRAAGRRIDIAADVGDHVVAAGEIVHIADTANIGGFVWLAAREVRIDGSVGQELRVAAERVIIAGEVAGNAEITAERIELLPTARLQGNLVWHSHAPPAVSEGALVAGQVIARPLPERKAAESMIWVGVLFVALMLLVTGAVLLLLFPRCFAAAAGATRASPGKSALLGLALFAATPFLGVLLLVTGVGWLLGVLVFLVYFASLPVAWFVAAFTLGTLATPKRFRGDEPRRWPRWLALLGGIVVLALLQLVPALGAIIALLALFFGLGGLALGCYRACAPAS